VILKVKPWKWRTCPGLNLAISILSSFPSCTGRMSPSLNCITHRHIAYTRIELLTFIFKQRSSFDNEQSESSKPVQVAWRSIFSFLWLFVKL